MSFRKIIRKDSAVSKRLKKIANIEIKNDKSLNLKQIIFGVSTFLLIFLTISFICFIKMSAPMQIFLENKPAPAGSELVADFSFSYESKYAKPKAIERIEKTTIPRFKKIEEPQISADTAIEKLTQASEIYLDFLKKDYPQNLESKENLDAQIDKSQANENLEKQAKSNNDNQVLTPKTKEDFALEKAIDFLKDSSSIAEENIEHFKSFLLSCQDPIEDLSYAKSILDGLFNKGICLQEDNKDAIFVNFTKTPALKTLKNAKQNFQFRLKQKLKNTDVFFSLYAILSPLITDNIVHSEEDTLNAIKDAQSNIKIEKTKVEKGDFVIAPKQIMTKEDLEKYKIYQEKIMQNETLILGISKTFLLRMIFTLLLLFSGTIFLKLKFVGNLTYRDIYCTCLVLILNLILNRFIINIFTDLGGDYSTITSAVVPIFFAPMIIVILLNSAPALFVSLSICVLTSTMLGKGSLNYFMIMFLSTMIAVYLSRNATKRNNILKAGIISGICLGIAISSVRTIFTDNVQIAIIQPLLAIVSGCLTSFLVIITLPIFEKLFKRTSHISLFEFTDTNNVYLRKLQIAAPGTYHHSLNTATLAEEAAIKIGASSLLCKVAAYWHDIGKIQNPEYFTENQNGENPHNSITPSISSLVLRRHVRDGIDIAKSAKLPKEVCDLIGQHHGTTFMSYFHFKANENKQKQLSKYGIEKNDKDHKNKNALSNDEANIYRYDGPKPQTKEAAILLLADSVQAASKSIKNLTSHAISDLLNKIFEQKIADGQLEECPITIKELNEIKESFKHTLDTMDHSRIKYPNMK